MDTTDCRCRNQHFLGDRQMMETKLFEIRDSMTCISAIGIRIDTSEHTGRERWLLRRAGYGDALILFGKVDGGPFCYDLYDQPTFTMKWAHHIAQKNWDSLKSGDMIDVQAAQGGGPMESDYREEG